MRKFLLCFLIALPVLSNGQELGVRFGETIGNNVAVDGVLSLKNKRVHANVSFGTGGVGVAALFEFLKPLGREAFHWYAGAGVSMFLGDPFTLGIPGELGLEYRFNIPLALGIDWRPTFVVVERTDFVADRFGLNIRYVFSRK